MSALPAALPLTGSRRGSGRDHLRLVQPGHLPDVPAPTLPPRGRRVLTAVVVTAATALSVGTGVAAGNAVRAGQPAVGETVVVSYGESLWTIAASVAEPGEDVREVVAEIVVLNELEDSELSVGQQLVLPA